jgi:hypothetical protein
MNEKDREMRDKFRAQTIAEIRKSSVLNRVEEAVNALDFSAEALEKLSKHMAGIDYGSEKPCDKCGRKGVSPEVGGKTLAYLAKVVNEQTRLLEYQRGNADSRTEITGVAELMKALTDEQFAQVNSWYEEGLRRNGAGTDNEQSH